MGTKHDLKEYYFAKEVVKDFPDIKNLLDSVYKVLYAKNQYLCVQHVLDAISDSRELIDRQYKQYKIILDKKGRIGE
jgi:hypothetical protein